MQFSLKGDIDNVPGGGLQQLFRGFHPPVPDICIGSHAESMLEQPDQMKPAEIESLRQTLTTPGIPGIALQFVPSITHDFRPSEPLEHVTMFHSYLMAITSAPANISNPPLNVLISAFSPKKMKASTMANTTPSLSTGATWEAGPSCKAR